MLLHVTFTPKTDTRVERNALMNRVYPKLRDFCHERGYEFQVVDMRWGVHDPFTDDHMIGEISLKELKACQALSTGPNFVVRRIIYCLFDETVVCTLFTYRGYYTVA